jgi:hypothetical protein
VQEFVKVAKKRKHLSYALTFSNELASQVCLSAASPTVLACESHFYGVLQFDATAPAVVVMNNDREVVMPEVPNTVNTTIDKVRTTLFSRLR